MAAVLRCGKAVDGLISKILMDGSNGIAGKTRIEIIECNRNGCKVQKIQRRVVDLRCLKYHAKHINHTYKLGICEKKGYFNY